jgi:serine/threonine protein kinase
MLLDKLLKSDPQKRYNLRSVSDDFYFNSEPLEPISAQAVRMINKGSPNIMLNTNEDMLPQFVFQLQTLYLNFESLPKENTLFVE